MRYRLRTLLMLLAVGPPVVAGAWLYSEWLLPAFFLLAGYSTYLFFFIAITEPRK